MRPHRVLIVEDDAPTADSINDALELAGYETRTACNGREALDVLADWKPDAIMADILMPEMDGYDLLKEVRSRPDLQWVAFIFVTAKTCQQDIRLGKALGADDFLVKPFEWDDLFVTVKSRIESLRTLKRVL